MTPSTSRVRGSPEPPRSTSAPTPRPTSPSPRPRPSPPWPPSGRARSTSRWSRRRARRAASSVDRFTYIPTGQLPITAQGQSLEIGGVPTMFTGFNAYQLATDWGTNAGCGGMATTAQIDAFFALAPPQFPRAVLGLPGNDGDERPHGSAGLAAPRQRVLRSRQVPRLPDPDDQRPGGDL